MTVEPAAAKRAHTTDAFAREETQLSNRNSGQPLEMLRHAVTPVGLHYLLIHFDIPYVESAESWTLDVGGLVERPLKLSIADLKALPQKTVRVTMECAGNGRALNTPRWQSMPWEHGAVGTAEWTGTPLRHILQRAGLKPGVVEIAFFGADRGLDSNVEHDYGRSLSPEKAMDEDILLVWAMNGQPLLPQHGFPLRLVVPGWYGMGNVKWLTRIEALDHKFQGFQQVRTYIYRKNSDDPGIPVTTMRVKSLMVPPGIPHWYGRKRLVDAGPVAIHGRAWAGGGVGIAKVEFGVGGVWQQAEIEERPGPYAWTGWRTTWHATPGEHEIMCRATDLEGKVQPVEQAWDNAGFGNNAAHRVAVTVRAKD
jgi:DMSO/TMAO reductase YedYZ molybdopterin-dependent catalytic subunit